MHAGWVCSSDIAQVTDRVVFSKMEPQEETVTATYSLTILGSFSWFISVFGHKVPNPVNFGDKLSTGSGVLEVISYLDSCVRCIGNPDEKFRCLSEARKGILVDSSGKKFDF